MRLLHIMANVFHHSVLIIPVILFSITGCFDSTTKFDTQSSSSQSSDSHLTITDISVSSAKTTNTISGSTSSSSNSFIIDSLTTTTTTIHSLNSQVAENKKTLIISGLPIYEVASVTIENSSGVFKNRFWLWSSSNTMRGVINYFGDDTQSGIQYSFQIYEEDATNFLEVKFNTDKEILTKYYHYDETGEFILSWPNQPLNPYDTRSPEEIVYHSRNYWMPDDSLGGLCAVSHKNSLTDPNCIEIDKYELMKWLNENNHPELPGWSWSSSTP